MRILAMLAMASALAACSTAPPMAPSAEAEAKLASLLAGKVAGPPIDCLPHWRTDRMVIIDDSTLVFEDGNTVYRNELLGECSNLDSGFYTLVTRSSGSSLCRGEIATVVDTRTGITVGSCAIGDFVPYRTP